MGALPPDHIAEVLTEIDPDVIALQGFTLNRVGDLVGRLQKDTDLHALTPVCSTVAPDVATTCC